MITLESVCLALSVIMNVLHGMFQQSDNGIVKLCDILFTLSLNPIKHCTVAEFLFFIDCYSDYKILFVSEFIAKVGYCNL